MGRQSLLLAIIPINQLDVRVCERDYLRVSVRASGCVHALCIFCKDTQIQHNYVRLYECYNVFVVNTLLLYHCCKRTPNANLPCRKSTQCL